MPLKSPQLSSPSWFQLCISTNSLTFCSTVFFCSLELHFFLNLKILILSNVSSITSWIWAPFLFSYLHSFFRHLFSHRQKHWNSYLYFLFLKFCSLVIMCFYSFCTVTLYAMFSSPPSISVSFLKESGIRLRSMQLPLIYSFILDVLLSLYLVSFFIRSFGILTRFKVERDLVASSISTACGLWCLLFLLGNQLSRMERCLSI